MSRPHPAPSGRAGAREQWWPWAGLLVGAVAAVPRFATPQLDTSDRVEIADHVVPGLVVIAVAVVVLVALRRPAPPAALMFVAGLVVTLAGLWMTATHVPLLAQASRGEAPWSGAVYHSASALIVLVFGLAWVAAHWSDID